MTDRRDTRYATPCPPPHVELFSLEGLKNLINITILKFGLPWHSVRANLSRSFPVILMR